MKKLSVSQLIGPVALFLAVAGAETASYALSRMPSSEWIWYLNLRWFGMFQESHYALQGRLGMDCEQLLLIALPLLLAACLGYRLRKSLLLAISSNLSFVYIGFVFYTWARAKSFPQTASLSGEFAASSTHLVQSGPHSPDRFGEPVAVFLPGLPFQLYSEGARGLLMGVSATLSYWLLVVTAATLFWVALTDLRHFKIRNDLIIVLIVLFFLYAVFRVTGEKFT